MVMFVVGPVAYPVGTAAFLGSFFDTVTVRLESGRRGARFPRLAALYLDGSLPAEDTGTGREELARVVRGLAAFPPSDVVWDMAAPGARPPWGDDVAPTITSLANYFVTSDGWQLTAVLDAALGESGRVGGPLEIR